MRAYVQSVCRRSLEVPGPRPLEMSVSKNGLGDGCLHFEERCNPAIVRFSYGVPIRITLIAVPNLYLHGNGDHHANTIWPEGVGWIHFRTSRLPADFGYDG